tara:strand:- start:282 stop:1172 length:891 start_codon:yes stop_codon:yes gene_type:complete
MICFPEGVDKNRLVDVIRNVCWKSSDILKSYSLKIENGLEIKKKLEINNLNSGPVTSADLEVNHEIIQGIKKNFPKQKWFFLSEESTKDLINKNHEFKEDWVWIIDPLDGTKDFIKNTGEYATHISLTYKKKNIFGAVLIPSREELWLYLNGLGSWCEQRNLQRKIYQGLRKKNLKDMRVVISKSHRYPELNDLINKIKPAKVIGMGSIGYKITSLIRNEADLYISFSDINKSCPKDWDMAAPEAIIKGYGGYFSNLNGTNLSFLKDNQYKQGGILIASMTSNHLFICEEIKKLLI